MGTSLFSTQINSVLRAAASIGAVPCSCLAVLQRWFPVTGSTASPIALWYSSAFPLCTPFSPQLEPVGAKTDSQNMENEIVLGCPSEVSYKVVCVCVEVLGVAGGLSEPLLSAWSSVSVRVVCSSPHSLCHCHQEQREPSPRRRWRASR